MLCKKLHHAAYRCTDATATARFYTDALGLEFFHAVGQDHVPSTGEYSPHIHIFFRMEDGSSIAFFECPHDPGDVKDRRSPDWIQHFAFEVENQEALLRAKSELETKGVQVLGPVDHDGYVLSIYFHDPSGHRLELTTQICPSSRLAQFPLEAPRTLENWSRTHDWSWREDDARG